jgi:hypothetical protein
LGVVALLAVTTSAHAGQARLFTGSFGDESTTVSDPYPLNELGGGGYNVGSVAVDAGKNPSEGDVYVVDAANHRVEKFDASGHFLLMFGGKVNKTAVEEGRPQPEQDVCPAVGHVGDVCQDGTAGVTPGSFASSAPMVAVDSSSGPSSGDIYVADTAVGGDDKVTKFDEYGRVISTWGSEGQLDGSTVVSPLPGPFRTLQGLAVDPAGNLWVFTEPEARAFEFGQNANFITDWDELPDEGFPLYQGYAVSSSGYMYLNSSGAAHSFKYTTAGEEVGLVSPGTNGIAFDASSNDLYVYEAQTVKRYDSSCDPTPLQACVPVETTALPHMGQQEFPGLALDSGTPSDTLYIGARPGGPVFGFSVETVPDVTTGSPSGFSSTGATLEGVVNPSGVALKECLFEWGEGEGESDPYGHIAACEPVVGSIPADLNAHTVKAAVSGLHAGGIYHFRLVAGNANDVNTLIDEPVRGGDVSFGAPSVVDESVSEVTATGATVAGVVAPHDADTHVRVEYGTEPGVYGQSTPDVDVGSAESNQNLSFPIQGLADNTVYYYRVHAENALGSSNGAERAFTTQPRGAFGLLDGRGWELVSPSDKLGAALKPISEGLVQAAVSGDAIAYEATAPTEERPPGNAGGVQVLSARGATGWSSRDVTAPHEFATGLVAGGEYPLLSSDLSHGVLQPAGSFVSSLSDEASEQTPFLRTLFTDGDIEDLCNASCYRPLLTGETGYENVAPETVFGEQRDGEGPLVVGASPDLAHVLIISTVPLTEGAPTVGLYEWSAGQLQLVSVLPDEEPAPESNAPGDEELARGAISVDGARVVWSEHEGKKHLYLRDVTAKKTLQLDTVQPGTPVEGKAEPNFQFASSDGSRVFFTDGQRLTSDSGGTDLYECTVVESGGGPECDLTDLTPPVAGKGSVEVLGAIAGGAENGSSVYFVANGVLSTNKTANGEEAVQGDCTPLASLDLAAEEECNLYADREGKISLVAVLAGADSADWARGEATYLQGLTTRVSSNGEWLVFMSQRSLTGYDNRDAVSGKADQEVYLYDAGDDKLICASCNPTGARPYGTEEEGAGVGRVTVTSGYNVFRTGIWIAANVPGWTDHSTGEALYQSRYLSDSGRLFFDSSDVLVPQDTNGTDDVYEYEPPGVGSCASDSLTFSATSNGCVDLVSSGSSSEASGFLDASENGNDVFFLTTAQLSKRDTDTALDVYDARVGGGEAEEQRPVECQGDGCQHPAVATEDPTPGSLTYQGPGNVTIGPALPVTGKDRAKPLTRAQKLANALKACRRKPRHKRAVCERQARKAYGSSVSKAMVPVKHAGEGR